MILVDYGDYEQKQHLFHVYQGKQRLLINDKHALHELYPVTSVYTTCST